MNSFNSFWNYFTPLFGAFVADTYLGRFRTIWICVIIAIIGHIILVISAIPQVISSPDSAIGVFAVGIIVRLAAAYLPVLKSTANLKRRSWESELVASNQTFLHSLPSKSSSTKCTSGNCLLASE